MINREIIERFLQTRQSEEFSHAMKITLKILEGKEQVKEEQKNETTPKHFSRVSSSFETLRQFHQIQTILNEKRLSKT
jgi:hypothetical protein